MGLQLNASQCELIAHPNFFTTDALLQSFIWVDVCDASLLGAPLFHDSELDKLWNGCCDDLARAAERLHDIGCQDVLILLRRSFSTPKVLHLLHPSVSHAALETSDSLLPDCIQRITNSNVSDIQWLQASLPVKDGGLEWDMCLCSQFPPIWHQWQAHSPSRWIFSLPVPAQMILAYSHTCRPGLLHLVPFQILCQLDNHSGTALASKLIASW